MKVFVLAPKEDWICDRLVHEWYDNFPGESVKNPYEADIIWLLAGWCWQQLPIELLKNKKLVVTEHHIVPEKFTQQKHQQFLIRDQFVNCYHVPNKKTKNYLKQLTTKEIKVISYWWNPALWKPTDKNIARTRLGIDEKDFCIGSFQRDTEGSDLITPKLEKGPDLFCDYIERVYREKKNIHILLGGWRRQYIINRLKNNNIKYTLFEKTNLKTIQLLYASCDLYIVSSRYEGGPQAIIEAAAMEVPIISTDVGIASSILPKNCIIDIEAEDYIPSKEDVKVCKENVNNIDIKIIGKKFINLFESLL